VDAINPVDSDASLEARFSGIFAVPIWDEVGGVSRHAGDQDGEFRF
jgi:hypothetical protein